MKIMITGANGHLGLRLMQAINVSRPEDDLIALVRSERAAQTIKDAGVRATINIIDYRSSDDLSRAGHDCDAVINLVGIIKETAANTFRMAHEDACEALVAAGIAPERVITLSIVGSDTASGNACLASRAHADAILLASPMPTTVLRVPMVLGPGDYASNALARNGASRLCFTFRSASQEQPIYSEDVVAAVIAALQLPPEDRVLELAGPESLSRAALIRRAGAVYGNSPVVVSLPLFLGLGLAGILELLSANPPVTRAMLGVLDHDDNIDPLPAAGTLGIELTSLDETLAAVLPKPSRQ